MWLLPISIIVFTIIIAVPLSRYMAKIMDGNYQPPRPLRWFEKKLDGGPQTWKQYTVALLVFNAVLFVYGYIVLSLQPWMPLNPRGLGMLAITYRNEFLHFMNRMTGFELFPASIYGFGDLPAIIDPRDIAIICGLSFVICIFGGVLPAIRAGRLKPVEALRYE